MRWTVYTAVTLWARKSVSTALSACRAETGGWGRGAIPYGALWRWYGLAPRRNLWLLDVVTRRRSRKVRVERMP